MTLTARRATSPHYEAKQKLTLTWGLPATYDQIRIALAVKLGQPGSEYNFPLKILVGSFLHTVRYEGNYR